jgi:sec-independent protein translocase protein TatA
MNILTSASSLLAMALSPTSWVIILLVVVLLFGGSKIPELMKGLGKGMGEFKKGVEESKTETEVKDETVKPA